MLALGDKLPRLSSSKSFAAHVGFIDALRRGPVQMYSIPISEAGLGSLEMLKVFQCESVYCSREKKAVAVLDSELWGKKKKKKKRIETPAESGIKTERFSAEVIHF